MSAVVAIPEASSARDISAFNGMETLADDRNATHFSVRSTLEELTGPSTILGSEATGEELGDLFARHPDLPGVIILEQGRFAGVVSQSLFYRCISRAFGREIYYRRSAKIMLLQMTEQPLILPSDCRIETAVEKCLTRSLNSIYEPFLVHVQESDEYRLCAFQALLLASSRIAALRNRQMEQILSTVTDGLFVIDKNFRIGGEYSKMVEKIFERSDLQGASLLDVLDPLLDASTCEQLQDYLKILFDPKLIDRLIKSINPVKQVSARFSPSNAPAGARTKHFAFYFERIRSQGEISQILVRVEDITQQLNLARELEQQEATAEERLRFVMQILQVEPAALNRFLTDFDQEMSQMTQRLHLQNGNKNVPELVHSFFRRVHTLKGEASLLRLAFYVRNLHQLEDILEKLRSAAYLETKDLASLKLAVQTLQNSSDEMRQSFDQLRQLGATPPAKSSSAPSMPNSMSLIGMLSDLISDLSRRLGKPARFHTTVKDHDLAGMDPKLLSEVLTHLSRNSMVHGVERPEERAARGKDPTAIIQLAVKSHDEFHEIIFQDDGGGLNLAKIRRRAGQLGWNLSSEEELRQAIFEPGFSTAKEVSELAGRGVGLDAIRHGLQKVGGRIVPYSEEGAYCAFQILIPKVSARTVG